MTISEDRPITSFDEDVLGYKTFCRTVARGLVEGRSTNSFVVGLHAGWGMGKTSAVNLIKQAVRDLEAKRPEHERTVIIDFNPWLFSGRDDLVRKFFLKLSTSLPQDLRDKAREFSTVARKRVVSHGEHVGQLVDATGYGWGVFGPLARFFGRLLGLEEQPLDTVRDELANLLREKQLRILILLDDVDRLLPAEMRDMLVLLRSSGDLPGIVYLVVCDRGLVEQGLKKAGVEEREVDGEPGFLEKIIQVDLHLPAPARAGLDAMLFEGIEAIAPGATARFDGRPADLYREAVAKFLDSPRRVVRLLNALRISWPAVKLEIDPFDFVALEALRLFARETYEGIRSSRHELVGWALIGDDELKRWTAEFLNKFGGAPDDARRQLLMRLFPRLRHSVAWHGDDVQERLDRRLSSETWEAYFRCEPDPDLGSAEFGRRVVAAINDQQALEEAIDQVLAHRDSKGRTLAGALLDDIRDHVKTRGLASAPLLKALLTKAEPLISAQDKRGYFSDFQRNNHMVMNVIFEDVLEATGAGDREPLIRELFSRPWATSFLAYQWWRLAVRAGVVGLSDRGGYMELPDVGAELLKSLKGNLKARLGSLANDGRLLRDTYVDDTLMVWREVAGSDVVSAWLATALGDPKFTVHLCDALMMTSYSSDGSVRRLVPALDGPKGEFVDRAYAAAKALDADTLAPDHAELIRTFVRSYESGRERTARAQAAPAD